MHGLRSLLASLGLGGLPFGGSPQPAPQPGRRKPKSRRPRPRQSRRPAGRTYQFKHPGPKHHKRSARPMHIRKLVNAGELSLDEAIDTLRSFPGGRDTSTYRWLLRQQNP